MCPPARWSAAGRHDSVPNPVWIVGESGGKETRTAPRDDISGSRFLSSAAGFERATSGSRDRSTVSQDFHPGRPEVPSRRVPFLGLMTSQPWNDISRAFVRTTEATKRLHFMRSWVEE